MVQARGNVETAGAQRRSAWGAYLPSVNASSSASEFFSEGTSSVDPVTGQVISGNRSNRSVSASLSASVDLFTGFRRGAEMKAAKAAQDAAGASLVDARFQQALTTTNQFFDALAASQLVSVREASVRRAEEQLKVSVAKLHAGSATRSDSLRSLVTLGTARLDLIQSQTDLATAEAGLARLIGESGPGRRGRRLRILSGHRRRSIRPAYGPRPRRALPRIQEATPTPWRRGPTSAPRGRLLAEPQPLGEHRAGTAAVPTTTIFSISGR